MVKIKEDFIKVHPNGLKVVSKDTNGKWFVEYVCGHTKLCKTREVLSNQSGMCSKCYKSKTATDKNTTHGMSKTPTYRSWLSMRARCLDENNNKYKEYGGAGITVCPTWVENFERFYSDMGDRPDGFTLERLDYSLGYSKSNCTWADAITQANNKSNVNLISDGNRVWSLKRWSEILSMGYKRNWYLLKKKGLPLTVVLGDQYFYV